MKQAVCRVVPRVFAVAAAVALPACKSVEVPKIPGLTPYRMTIQQGNYLSQEMVAQLKPGMTREQVRYVLGTPLVTDMFHADRWDYVFYRELPDGKREQRNLSVVFEKDKLARVLGDLLPAEGTAPVQATGFAPIAKPDTPAKPAAEAPKPATEAPKPAAEASKPAAEAPAPAAAAGKPAEDWTPTQQNWGAASDQPAAKPEPAPAEKSEPAAKEAEAKPAQDSSEKGFFGRMLEKIGL
ncbi:MAG TPA: outer membrane protein assembly factor BamE [Burkholderiales bacterium]|nr:outer membrane protein assembly factor BamE [Burkholderiales bacterium]